MRDLMTAGAATLHVNDQLTLASDVMHLGRIRHMPVLDTDGRLAGLVSQRDLFRGGLARALGIGTSGHRKLLDTLSVKDVMVTDLQTTTPDTELSAAALVMATHKVGCLPVLEGGELVGILTEGDFVAYFARR